MWRYWESWGAGGERGRGAGGEEAGDESEGTDTGRDIPQGEEEEEGEEEENIQGQREEQPEGQQVDPCRSSAAPLGLRCREGVPVQAVCKAVSFQFIAQCVH